MDHQNGTLFFIEIKLEHVEIEKDAPGHSLFKHLYPGLSLNTGIFTLRAPWDFLLPIVRDRTRGYLISKDDIPPELWHQIPRDGYYVTQGFSDPFLDRHRVYLGNPFSLVTAIQRILRGPNYNSSDGSPYRVKLTVEQIIARAGPCPPILLTVPREVEESAGNQDLLDDLPTVEGDEAREGEARGHAPQSLADPQSKLKFTGVEISDRRLINTGLNAEDQISAPLDV